MCTLNGVAGSRSLELAVMLMSLGPARAYTCHPGAIGESSAGPEGLTQLLAKNPDAPWNTTLSIRV